MIGTRRILLKTDRNIFQMLSRFGLLPSLILSSFLFALFLNAGGAYEFYICLNIRAILRRVFKRFVASRYKYKIQSGVRVVVFF